MLMFVKNAPKQTALQFGLGNLKYSLSLFQTVKSNFLIYKGPDNLLFNTIKNV